MSSKSTWSITTISHHACQSNINKKKDNTRLFGSSPWGLVAMYAVSQWPAPFIKSSCLGWVWANALQYDSHYTPRWASCAPRPFLILFLVQGFPTSSLSLSLFCILFSVPLSHHPLLFSPLLRLPFLLSPFIYRQTFLWGSLSPTALKCNFCSLLPRPSLDGNL